MTIEEIVQQSRDLLDLLPAQALARARERHPGIGGFAVFAVYAPVEIIHAAGLMPVGLFGAGDKIELSHAESRFQSSGAIAASDLYAVVQAGTRMMLEDFIPLLEQFLEQVSMRVTVHAPRFLVSCTAVLVR